MSSKTIAIPGELYERLQAIVVAEDTTVEAFVTKAIERVLVRRWLEGIEREALARRGNMTDDEVEAVAVRAIQECRGQAATNE